MNTRSTSLRQQRGTVVFIALIVFVVLMLAGAALMRSVGSGTLVIGNLGFKQAATSSGDAGLEIARRMIVSTAAAGLKDNGAVAGYFATWGPNPAVSSDETTWTDAAFFDPAVHIDWSKAALVNGGKEDATGNVVRYVIHRLCRVPGAPAAGYDPSTKQQCVMWDGADPGSTHGNKGPPPLGGADSVYYRITAQVRGPKGTTSYVQAMVR